MSHFPHSALFESGLGIVSMLTTSNSLQIIARACAHQENLKGDSFFDLPTGREIIFLQLWMQDPHCVCTNAGAGMSTKLSIPRLTHLRIWSQFCLWFVVLVPSEATGAVLVKLHRGQPLNLATTEAEIRPGKSFCRIPKHV